MEVGPLNTITIQEEEKMKHADFLHKKQEEEEVRRRMEEEYQRQSQEEDTTQRLEKEKLTQEIEEVLEGEDTIQLMDDERGTPEEPPLTSGHLPFEKMGIPFPQTDRFMDVCSVTFDQFMKMIMQQRHR